MTVHLWDLKFSYVSVPKCGCSYLKALFMRLQSEKPIRGMIPIQELHEAFRTVHYLRLPRRAMHDHVRVAVIRNPEARFASAFENKIVGQECLKQDLTPKRLKLLGLTCDPSPEEFLKKLNLYRISCPVVFKHFQALSFFLGPRADWYTRIYDISQIGELADYACKLTGKKVILARRNQRRRSVVPIEITPKLRALIAMRYKTDVALFGRFFATNPGGIAHQA